MALRRLLNVATIVTAYSLVIIIAGMMKYTLVANLSRKPTNKAALAIEAVAKENMSINRRVERCEWRFTSQDSGFNRQANYSGDEEVGVAEPSTISRQLEFRQASFARGSGFLHLHNKSWRQRLIRRKTLQLHSISANKI